MQYAWFVLAAWIGLGIWSLSANVRSIAATWSRYMAAVSEPEGVAQPETTSGAPDESAQPTP